MFLHVGLKCPALFPALLVQLLLLLPLPLSQFFRVPRSRYPPKAVRKLKLNFVSTQGRALLQDFRFPKNLELAVLAMLVMFNDAAFGGMVAVIRSIARDIKFGSLSPPLRYFV